MDRHKRTKSNDYDVQTTVSTILCLRQLGREGLKNALSSGHETSSVGAVLARGKLGKGER